MNDLETARKAALLGRETAVAYLSAENKGNDPSNPYTAADLEAEREMRAFIRKERSEDAILGEEFGGEEQGRTWILDPIDGTINWMRGLPGWSSAVALKEDGQTLVSAIAMPEGVYVAKQGGGAMDYVGEPLEISPRTPDPREAVVGTYLDGKRGQQEEFLSGNSRLTKNTATLRAIGAGSHDFLLLAKGQLDGIVQYRLAPWDRAPGELIVLESGGAVEEAGSWFIAASSRKLAKELAAVVGN